MGNRQETLAVIGNGMVGHRFIEKMVDFDTDRRFPCHKKASLIQVNVFKRTSFFGSFTYRSAVQGQVTDRTVTIRHEGLLPGLAIFAPPTRQGQGANHQGSQTGTSPGTNRNPAE